MNKPLRIFIGSSSEARDKAEILQELLYDQEQELQLELELLPWWSPRAFPINATFVDSLLSVMQSTDAALLLATEDDKTIKRGKEVREMRDNISMEYGMSLTYHGPQLTALAVIGKPALPSDISGVTYLQLSEGNDFKERNRGKIRDLVLQWQDTIRVRSPSVPSHAAAPPVPSNTEVAQALVNELFKYRDDLLSNINLVERYQVNRIAIPLLCEKMNAVRTKEKSTGHVVTLAEYLEFDNRSQWQWLAGYRHQTTLTAADRTEPISGVGNEEREVLKSGSGVDPRQVSPSTDRPVCGVSWYDAAVFCLFSGGRLPTKEELTALPAIEKQEVWEWTQSWFSEEVAHIAVARRIDGGEFEFIGANPDLRLPQIGFRIIRQH